MNIIYSDFKEQWGNIFFYNTVNFQPVTFRILFFRGIQTLQMRLSRKACFWWTRLLRPFCRAADDFQKSPYCTKGNPHPTVHRCWKILALPLSLSFSGNKRVQNLAASNLSEVTRDKHRIIKNIPGLGTQKMYCSLVRSAAEMACLSRMTCSWRMRKWIPNSLIGGGGLTLLPVSNGSWVLRAMKTNKLYSLPEWYSVL